MILENINVYVSEHSKQIAEWLDSKSKDNPYPIFSSIDIRNAGYKIAPVDTNLFPAGFNNISEAATELLAKHIKDYFAKQFNSVNKILLFPENFTRNIKYLESLYILHKAFEDAGFDVRLGSTVIDSDYNTENGLLIENFTKFGSSLINSAGWKPDIVVLNNDLTDGIPDTLQHLDIPVIPNPALGWHRRLKHQHFLAYDALVMELCSLHDMDPWLMTTYFENCGMVDFKNKVGLECLAQSVENVLEKIRDKYKKYSINETPFVFVKADQGTYGMGVMVVRSGDEIVSINKKKRHSMQTLKSGVQNTNLIAQEGVPTIEKYNGFSAETMSYMCGGKVVDTFSRYHTEKDPYSNLNSTGMGFTSSIRCLKELKALIAQLASLATAFEV